ncbi:hypothetical protein UA08_03764 [Talaromyces atroroseus]|uniref:Transcription factor domain-containing protein n=1 Tax=Talaromyces atroroseus TaxID=1441469 RepID=A0A225B010_TALAT|nr:hypothetical protein UA08_03764 [Talaromyces atroroseus]OKL61289.1 hypothetical protein UA08_03764 [Talaromyces atroroseus]
MLLFEGFYTSLYNHNQSLASYIGAFTKIIIESNDGSSVRLAVSAVIRGFYSFILRSREMGALAETDFTTAVSLARVALDDPEESKSDVTLLTILLLSMFEAAAVMGADVSILTELLEASLFLPPPSSHYFSSFPITFVVPIAQLRLRVEKTNIYSKFDVSTAEDLLSSATQLDKDLSQWPDKITPSYHPRRSWSLPSDFGIGSSEGYPGWADTYPSLALAQDWNYYRYLRIVLNIFISRCAALLRKYSLAASADQVCEQMVDDTMHLPQ